MRQPQPSSESAFRGGNWKHIPARARWLLAWKRGAHSPAQALCPPCPVSLQPVLAVVVQPCLGNRRCSGGAEGLPSLCLQRGTLLLGGSTTTTATARSNPQPPCPAEGPPTCSSKCRKVMKKNTFGGLKSFSFLRGKLGLGRQGLGKSQKPGARVGPRSSLPEYPLL